MNQVERICHMEKILDRTQEALDRLSEALEAWEGIQRDLSELEQYYESPEWMADFSADEAGELPPELKRGVLSEDAVWQLLEKRDVLLARLRELKGDIR